MRKTKIKIRNDSVVIEGYVNAIERNSKPLISRVGKFVERICKGAFTRALSRNDDVRLLENHDWDRDLGGTGQGSLELSEDSIGLKARAVITDAEAVQKAKRGDYIGWSFGFKDREVENTVEHGMPTRAVKDMDLYEVSILDRSRSPAYDGTLVAVRSDENDVQFRSEPFIDDVITEDETREEAAEKTEPKETREEKQPKQQETVKEKIDYSEYEQMIQGMKGEK